jgi:hypothetical protein
MELLVLTLTALIGLAHLGDFLLGIGGQRRIKDRMVDLYVAASENDWAVFVRATGAAYHSYLCKLFRIDGVSWQMLIRIVFYSLTISLISHILWFSLDPTPLLARTPTWPYAGFLGWSCLVNIAFDYFSIACTASLALALSEFGLASSITNSKSITDLKFRLPRFIQFIINILERPIDAAFQRVRPLRQLADLGSWLNERQKPILVLCAPLSATVAAFLLVSFAQLAVAQYVILGLGLDPGERWHLLHHRQSYEQDGRIFEADKFFKNIFEIIAAWQHWSIPRFQIVLPALVFAVFAICVIAIYAIGAFVRRPLLVIFERLEESKTGILRPSPRGLAL